MPRKLQENLDQAREWNEKGKTSKAAGPARRAYSLAAEHLPVGHPVRQEAARLLGLLLLNLNQAEEAGRLLEESGDRSRSTDPALDEDEIGRRNNETFLRLKSGETEGLVEHALAVVADARRLLAPDSLALSLSLSHLGNVHEAFGDMKQAERAFKEALEIRRRGEGEGLAAALLDLARIHLKAGRLAKAEPLYREALALQDGEEGVGLAVTLTQLAHVCQQTGRPGEALEHLHRSLRIRQEALGADHPQVVTALHGLAAHHMKAENHDEADRYLEQGLLILERSLGSQHPRTIQFVMERGMNRLGQGRATPGLEHLAEAHSRAAASLPPFHPFLGQIESYMAAGRALRDKLGT